MMEYETHEEYGCVLEVPAAQQRAAVVEKAASYDEPRLHWWPGVSAIVCAALAMSIKLLAKSMGADEDHWIWFVWLPMVYGQVVFGIICFAVVVEIFWRKGRRRLARRYSSSARAWSD